MEQVRFEVKPSNGTFNLEQYKVDKYNNQSRKSSVGDCPICKNKGLIAYLDEDGAMQLKQCKCYSVRRSREKLEDLGILEFAKELKSINNLSQKEEWEQSTFKILTDYLANNEQSKWLFIGGQVGSGKTTKCVLVLLELLKQRLDASVEYFNWDTSYKKLVFADEKDKAILMSNLKNADILYLDDFFRHRDNSKLTDIERDTAKEIIDWRYTHKLQTLISSELLISEIMDMDEAIGTRIYQMCEKKRFVVNIQRDRKRNYRMEGFYD